MQADIDRFYADSLAGFSTSDIIGAMHYLDRMRENFVALDRAQGGQDLPEE